MIGLKPKILFSSVPISESGRTAFEIRNKAAFAAIRDDGSVITWGDPETGGDSSNVSKLIQKDVVQIFATRKAFAALKTDGSVVAWGDKRQGGNTKEVDKLLERGVKRIFSTGTAFVALKEDKTVVAWGDPERGGSFGEVKQKNLNNISLVASTFSENDNMSETFAALRTDGSVITWGDRSNRDDSNTISIKKLKNVSQIIPNHQAFAFLLNNGKVKVIGNKTSGGELGRVSYSHEIEDDPLNKVFPNSDTSLAPGEEIYNDSERLKGGIIKIVPSYKAFAALKKDGSVVTWGRFYQGGDSREVRNLINKNVVNIFSCWNGFAALKSDGSIVSWGGWSMSDRDNVVLPKDVELELNSGVVSVFSTGKSMAALKEDGSVVTWGSKDDGGDSSKVKDKLSSKVINIFSTNSAFAALKSDGSVVTWGSKKRGGESHSVAENLQSDVVHIYSSGRSFAALKNDGTVISWGEKANEFSSHNSSQPISDVVSISTPFLDDKSQAIKGKKLLSIIDVRLNNKDTNAKNVKLFGHGNPDAFGNKYFNTLLGNKGNNRLLGKNGNDILNGKSGDDFLSGGKGVDIITGGDGADAFKSSKGLDYILDFEVGVDQIVVDNAEKVKLHQTTDGLMIIDGSKEMLLEEINFLLFGDPQKTITEISGGS